MAHYQKFWRWFVEHEQDLLNFEKDRERVFDELANELQKVDCDLTFEFGPKEAKREFVVSAGGVKRAFPAVTALTAAAPRLENWEITAFRQRRGALETIEFGDKRVDPKDVRFALLDNGKIAGIYLFIPGYQDHDIDFKQIGYLLLDALLGEYDVEMGVGLIKMFAPEANIRGERFPLATLPELFDKLTTKLNDGHDFKN